MTEIDWSDFDGDAESTCYCGCGAVYRSHAKSHRQGETITTVTRKHCPDCGSHTDCRRISSDPESFTVRG